MAAKILDEYTKDFQKRNSTFREIDFAKIIICYSWSVDRCFSALKKWKKL